jgi:hypothetical protein
MSDEITRLTASELEQGLDHILASPTDAGTLELVVKRPAVDEREVLEEGFLDEGQGLVGDNWLERGSHQRPGAAADPEMQLNIMNARVASLVAVDPERRALAGDQLYVDLDLSSDNLPPGTRLAVGEAVIEVTEPPHTGCKKFAARFGVEAMVFVNSGLGKAKNFRGINARVITSGAVRVGDRISKLEP